MKATQLSRNCTLTALLIAAIGAFSSFGLAAATPAKPAMKNTTTADFGVWEVAYKVSESDFNIKRSLAKAPVNEWAHQSDISRVKTQQVIRENQDVIYSSAVVDISKGAKISVPRGQTYHIIEIIDMQNYVVDVLYPGQSRTVTTDDVTYGNYVYLNMRIRKFAEEKGGLEATLKQQHKAQIEANSAVPYSSPAIVLDGKKLEQVRLGLIQAIEQGEAFPVSKAVGSPYNTEPKAQLFGTAYGWGGLPIEDAAYLPIDRNETKIENGKALPSSVTFTPPAIDYKRGGFWSITTYDKEGWLAKDKAAISNTEATANADGSYTIRFNSPGQPNNVDTPAPFAVLLRMYVPKSKQEVIRFMEKAQQELVIK
jgi:hypothetical protein